MRTVQEGRGSCQAHFAACVMIIMPDMTFEGLLHRRVVSTITVDICRDIRRKDLDSEVIEA